MRAEGNLCDSNYKTIAVIDEEHKVYLVQDIFNKKIYIRKIMHVYNVAVYEHLYRHPIDGIPRILYYEEEQGQLSVVEQYISGDSLDEKISQGELCCDAIASYMVQLCEILEKLHTMNPPVIHRDIKPSNIIITAGERVVLLDFNAARHQTLPKKKDTVLIGTQGYAAPEQYGFGESGPQTDIYAVGIVLREMVDSLIERVGIFDEIIRKCTQLRAVDRYQSAAELKAVLLSVLAYQNGSFAAQPRMDGPMRRAAGGQAQDSLHRPEPSGWRRFLPPGYRTAVPWKMLLAAIGYLCIFYFSLTLQFEPPNAVSQWTQRICVLLMLLTLVATSFNYMNIRRLMPFAEDKRRVVRYLAVFFLDVALIVLIFIYLVVVENVIFPESFHV